MHLFRLGDLVRIYDVLPSCKAHFYKGCYAIITKQSVNANGSSYGVFIPGVGEISWYDDQDLYCIARDQSARLEAWQRDYHDVSTLRRKRDNAQT